MVEPHDVRRALRVDAPARASRDRRPRRPPAATTGAPNVRPPSRIRAILISVPRSFAFQATTTSGSRGADRADAAPPAAESRRRRGRRPPRGSRCTGAPKVAPSSRLVATKMSLLPSAAAPQVTATNRPCGRDPRRRVGAAGHGERDRHRAPAPTRQAHGRSRLQRNRPASVFHPSHRFTPKSMPGSLRGHDPVTTLRICTPQRQLPAPRIAHGRDLVEGRRRTRRIGAGCRSWCCAPSRSRCWSG